MRRPRCDKNVALEATRKSCTPAVLRGAGGPGDAAAAHTRLADPERFGKVVLAIPGTGA
jgi:hypothetical protein